MQFSMKSCNFSSKKRRKSIMAESLYMIAQRNTHSCSEDCNLLNYN